MKKTVVITSIANDQNPILSAISDGCADNNMHFIVVGDKKSPDSFQLDGCTYLSVADQEALGYQIVKLLPYNHYCRKNIGYLEAIRAGSELVIDTDDDNIPKDGFWVTPEVEWNGPHLESAGWVNVYRYFSEVSVWPRGFPLNQVRKSPPDLAQVENQRAKVPIRQGLADDNPDVDAIYRMVGDLPLWFRDGPSIALGRDSICPFNSQNTQFFPEAYPLLYLPSFCSFRMTDIWRSFVAQVAAWQHGWSIGFTKATVVQDRNEHDLMKDFREELDGYLHNESIVDDLMAVDLDTDPARIGDNMIAMYEVLVSKGYVGAEEIPLLAAWLEDLKDVSK
ncbi:STELLO glycosyltransferase family protein [Vreelandella janggokensis]|uniref:STELLO glycosyltransferase family protein n=1 Tax=Vreelandella janggokensis TaxID=370767 RepID=UPI00285DAF9E|nr:STELLO glycosyltransferase family protein [Halomonas janggokensis]MDR5886696.1 STELLO glycosyltransferase family protein [Halomonas janggokensis]